MRYFEDIKAGEHYDLGSRIVEKSEMLEYAQKYNRSYLHTNESIMKKTRYGDVIAPGMYTFSIPWAAFIDMDIFKGGEIGGTETTVQWFKGVYAGDTLTSEAIVREVINSGNSLGLVVVEIRTTNQEHKMVLRSVNKILVRKRERITE
ncbi:MaoC family dehydratase N-terminal domain-containing protein [Lachnospiraceae bacterium 47-T17]